MEIKEILESLGYSLVNDKDGWRTSRIYANGDNKTALKIYKNGFWQDFVDGRQGRLVDLISLTRGWPAAESKAWLKNNEFDLEKLEYKEKLKMKKKYDKSCLDRLVKDHSYWVGRGIDEEIVALFDGGVAMAGQLKDRYVFPIFDGDDLVGFAGRDLTGQKLAKWFSLPEKTQWIWPLHLNEELIEEKSEVILVESVGDTLALWQAGIKNVICIFGTSVLLGVLNYLIRTNPKKIILSLNNDENGAGNRAMEKNKKKLQKYFDFNSIQVIIPPLNDWNDLLLKNGSGEIEKCFSK